MPINMLNSLLKPKIIEYHNNTGDYLSYSLKEKDKTATLRVVNLLEIPKNTVFLQLDTVDTATLFCGTKSNGLYENMRCDYLIITPKDVYFIELKSNQRAPTLLKNECIGKFKASLCLSKYIDDVIEHVREKDRIFINKHTFYVLIYQGVPLDKTATSLKPKQHHVAPDHVAPDKFLSIPVANNGDLYFRELLG